MSGFRNAVRVGSTIVILPTCNGGGWWECSNLLEDGQSLCAECAALNDSAIEEMSQ